MDLGAPGSYLTLATGTPVYSADEQELGRVDEVRAADDLDIFDGVGISGGPAGKAFVTADHIEEIFERGVLLRISAAEAEALPATG